MFGKSPALAPIRELVERAWFRLCLGLGRLLRASRYSTTVIVRRNGTPEVRKRRRFYAPVLISLGGVLMRGLDTGVRILPRREWQENERFLHDTLYGATIRPEPDGTLILPWLTGSTLAAILEDPVLGASTRKRAMELAASALAAFHAAGFTHGDAMAENVIVDLDGGVARWFDFETVHDPRRTFDWRRTDDLRALMATCLLRSAPDDAGWVSRSLLAAYRDESIMPGLAECFSSTARPSLVFHLAQAGLSFERYRMIVRLLGQGN